MAPFVRTEGTRPMTALSTIEHVTFRAPNITCGHCVRNAQEAVRDLEGVIEAHASAETRFVDVDFDPAVISLEQLGAALAAAGYPVQD